MTQAAAARSAPSATIPRHERPRIADCSAVLTLLVRPSGLSLTRLPAVGTEVTAKPLAHTQAMLSYVRTGTKTWDTPEVAWASALYA